jgi:hypothetical protein
MATDVFINIKDLPEITETKNGDYLIIETSTGTNLIDFKNFVIPTDNTVITTTVTQNTDALIALSGLVDSNYSQLFGSISNNLNDVSVLSNYVYSNINYNLNVAKTQITIPINNTEGSNVLSKLANWSLKDIIISPANAYATKYPAYPISVDANGVVTIRGTFNVGRIISIDATPLSITSSITPTSALKDLTVDQYTSSLSVKDLNIANLITNLRLSAEYIPAEEPAVYNVYAINYSS